MSLPAIRRLFPPAAWLILGAGLAAGAFLLADRTATLRLPGLQSAPYDAAAFQALARQWAASDTPWLRSTLRHSRDDLDRLLVDLTFPLLRDAALPTPFPDRIAAAAPPAFVFIDFACPACQADHPLLAEAADTGAVTILPVLLPDPADDAGLRAARAAHWAADNLPGRYPALHRRLMTDGPAALPAILDDLAIQPDWIEQSDPEAFERHIAHTRLIADALIVHGTPASVTRETIHRGSLALRPDLLTAPPAPY